MQNNNIVYAQILNELGLVYREFGNYSKALQLMEESLFIKEKV